MVKVLVICDDKWHPAEVIRRSLAVLGGSEFDFDIVEDAKDILMPKMLEQYPIIMNCKCNAISAANEHAWFDKGVTEVGPNELREYIEKGGGFLSVHSGNAFFKGDTSGYLELVGNYFVQHPPRCDVEIHITAEHPVTDGVEDFCVRDEHYEIALTVDDTNELFVTRSATGGEQIGGYTRDIGKGRLCVLTPGHILDVWTHPMFQKLLGNAIRWCAKSHK
ncbi:hypothetical protein FACS18949_17450 [Clostridia bacterium]|nr:hypothetical protein FACS18949_17450 [Clostridia bacterium]